MQGISIFFPSTTTPPTRGKGQEDERGGAKKRRARLWPRAFLDCDEHSFPEARGGLKHHTVISSARHLPWVPGRAAASEAGAGLEKVHPTKHRGTAERERSTAPELH